MGGGGGIAHHSPNLKKKINGLSPSIKINQFKIADNYFFKNRKIELHITQEYTQPFYLHNKIRNIFCFSCGKMFTKEECFDLHEPDVNACTGKPI